MDEKMTTGDKVRKFVSDHPALVMTTAYVGVFAVSYVGGKFLSKKYEQRDFASVGEMIQANGGEMKFPRPEGVFSIKYEPAN